jgi:ParB family transcriptional regulator, chromosome partitioning protein
MTLRHAPREFRDVPLGLIDDPRLASRASMNEEKLEELARDMARNGVISPLSIGKVGDRFEVVAGHRRAMAARRAGLATVPCVVYGSVDAAHEAIKFAENRYREELNAAEEAIWFSELLERDCGGDVDRLCEQLGIKRTYAESRLLLFQGDRAIFDALQADRIGIGVAQELNRCTEDAHRKMLLHQAIVGGATKAVVNGWLTDWQRQQRYAADASAPSSEPIAPIAPLDSDYFKCYVCTGRADVHAMRPLNVHSYCVPATLDKALEQYARRGDALLYPRTIDEARELIADLLSRFPTLVNP